MKAIDVTEVRKALIADSYKHHALVSQYAAKLRAGQNPTQADFDAFEGHVAAAAYTYLAAAVLRQVAAFRGDAEAAEMAALFDAVRETGIEVLEDANADLDEQAPPTPSTTAEIHVTFGPSMPGVGKSLAAALMENDVPAEPETTPAVSS